MALVNAFSSLSLAAPKAAGLGFKKAVAAFAQPAARVSGARVAFAVEAKQNKRPASFRYEARPQPGHGARERTPRARILIDTRVNAREARSARAPAGRVARNARALRAVYQNLVRLFREGVDFFLRAERRVVGGASARKTP